MSNILTKDLGVVAPVPKGEYNIESYYEKLNIVQYNGFAYIAKQPSKGVPPTNTEYWQLLIDGLRKEDIVDNLESSSADKPLSAKQGNVLNENFENSLESNYYDEITYKKGRVHHTDYYITYIPKYDNQNNIIMPYVAYNNGKSPSEYARENYTTFSSNCTLGIGNPGGGSYGIPSVISNGEIIREHDLNDGQDVADNYIYLGIKADRSIVEYKVNSTSAQDMINDGCLQVFNAYYRLLENGIASDLTNVVTNEPNVVTDEHPRQSIGIKADGTIVMLTCDGRTYESYGLTSAELQDIFLEENCIDAWNLDGGGSASTSIRGSKLNRNIDNNGTTDRGNAYSLNVKKVTVNEGTAKAFSKIGEEKQNLIQQIIPYIQETTQGLDTTTINGADLNNQKGKIIFGYGTNLTNTPNNRAFGYLINIPHAVKEYRETYNTQIFVYRDYTESFIRNQVNGVWKNWERLSGSTRVMITPSSSTFNKIATTNTYQELKMKTISGSADSQNIIVFDETTKDASNNYTSFKVNKTGFMNIRVSLNYVSNTASKKFIKITENGTTEYAVYRNNMDIEEGLVYSEAIIACNPTKNYQIQLYGYADDEINSGSIIVEML